MNCRDRSEAGKRPRGFDPTEVPVHDRRTPRYAVPHRYAAMSGSVLPYRFQPEERPVFPGAPYAPRQTTLNRCLYALSALVMAMTAGLSNGLVSVNLLWISGNVGLYASEGSLLLAVYVAFNATANLLLVKARTQFGIPATMHTVLVVLIGGQCLQMLWPSFGMEVVAQAVSGIAAGGLTSLTLYNLFQVFPLRYRPMALVIGFGLPPLAIPIARLFPIDIIALNDWYGLHVIVATMGLAALTMLVLMPLPPTERAKVFEPLDAATVGLTIPAMLLICTVLAEGRFLWWTDAPWLGWALAIALPLLGLALLIEARRARPLLWVRWFATVDILRFALIALVFRVALAEQTYSAIGLLTLGGLTSDQLHTLFLFVLFAMVAGTIAAAVLAKPERFTELMLVAALVIALGAWLDTASTSETRPTQLLLSQSLLGFGAALFLGPALLDGLRRVTLKGPTHLVSFVVLFSTTQNVGGLIGVAFLGTLQTARARLHAEAIAESVSLGDPGVISRLAQNAEGIARVVIDPAHRQGEANALLGSALQDQANVLAFNDSCWAVTWIALATTLLLLSTLVNSRFRLFAGARHLRGNE